MTKREQKKLVRDLSKTVAKSIEDLIQRGKIPAEWDGHELRCLLADRHADNASVTVIKREPHSYRARFYAQFNTTL